MNDKAFEIEDDGYQQGINPFFGRFFRKFDIAPVPYENRNRLEFRSRFEHALENIKYAFTGEVKVVYTLYQEEQQRLETPDLADLDNYAKLLNDCIKGPGGLLIDDCQIQSLSICWIDTGLSPYFELEIQGTPDDFVLKPFALYEMPDYLYYPISEYAWTIDGLTKIDTKTIAILLKTLFKMIRCSRSNRHRLRQDGTEKLKAFWQGRPICPSLMGQHKSRIINTGFTIINIAEWMERYKDLIKSNNS